VHLAAVADRFLFLERAAGETLMGIGAQLLAFGAVASAVSIVESMVETMVIPAIDGEHRIDGALLVADSGTNAGANARADDARASAGVDIGLSRLSRVGSQGLAHRSSGDREGAAS
jgi:hypothetical protein